jgi:hypothetical protein
MFGTTVDPRSTFGPPAQLRDIWVGVITRKENRPKGGESPPCRGLPWGKKLEETPPEGGQKFLTLGLDRVKNEVYCVNTPTHIDDLEH